MKKTFKKILLALFITFIVLPSIFLAFFYMTYNKHLSFKEGSFIEVHPGASLNRVLIDLRDNYNFNNELEVKLIMKLLFLEDDIKPGRHDLSNILSIKDLVKEITSVTVYSSITILEGWAINDIARYLSNHKGLKIINEDLFKKKCNDKDFINNELVEKMNFYNVANLEGFLFPETYNVDSYINEEDLLKIFIQEYLKQIKPLQKDIKNINQIMIIASIIEAETNNVNEMDTISAVYNNRINREKPMLLQADPTVLYYMTEKDLKKFKNSKPGTRAFGDVWYKYKEMNNLYNTYKYIMPPGPINSPRIEAIEAALNPAETDYLFMVMNNRLGKHLFAKDETGHSNNIKRN